MTRKLKVLALLLVLGGAAWGRPFDNGCTGTGTNGPAGSMTLICEGTCSPGQTCQQFNDGQNDDGAFSYCGCFSGDQDVCCTVIIQGGVAKKKGTCPPCGASGLCILKDNPAGNDNEPVCKLVEPP